MITNVSTSPITGDRNLWCGIPEQAMSYVIAEAAQKHSGTTVLFATDANQAQRWFEELNFFLGKQNIPIAVFPDWETLPYDAFSPHQDIISDRLRLLSKLPSWSQGIVIVPVITALHRLAPTNYIQQHSLVLKNKDSLDLTSMREQLERSGYQCVSTVQEHGEFAVRGSILDIFPMGSKMPFRIELFDDEVESIRTFDPENQRSITTLESIEVLPAKEFPLHKNGISTFKNRWHTFFSSHRDVSIYDDVSKGISAPGIEYYLPLFFEKTATLFDYLPKNTLMIYPRHLPEVVEHLWKDIQNRYSEYNIDHRRPLLPPNEIFLRNEQFFEKVGEGKRLLLTAELLEQKAGMYSWNFELPPTLHADHRETEPLKKLIAYAKTNSQKQCILCVESPGRRETLIDLLRNSSLSLQPVQTWQQARQPTQKMDIYICVGPLDRGFILADQALIVLTEQDIFGQRVAQSRRRQRDAQSRLILENAIKHLSELEVGAPIAHITHGIGRYQGLQTLSIEGAVHELMMIEYADGAKLYVPVTDLHLVGRYSGVSEIAPWHRLGSDTWDKEKRKAAEKARDAAAELLDIYARRAAEPGMNFDIQEQEFDQFSGEFEFEETPDQADAIDAVLEDMKKPTPMDRLVCGDVGFGKTEVAMRATFIAVNNSMQVAILVPTTLLAEQHYQSFKDRFANWPVRIEVLSRFKSAADQKKTLAALAAGQVDIVIGTHKLLQKDIEFKNLGLLIIDEEHRFGVRHKEQLKRLRAQVDVLALTATPIPRTLNMAMSGLRDVSIIATPPAKRLSIKTFVREVNSIVVKEALLRELLRGGQVYYLHNEVKTIENTRQSLSQLVPEARVAVAHGQMPERELERVMSDFYHKRFNVLVCTTIIETGIDIPNANTIIIDRADKLGLAQLHQIRGRVGRSHHQAYAYLLTPPTSSLTGDAVKRLEAIEHAQDLGAGFVLASQDLEIRGAGELLGEEQSGQMHSIGFHLYMEMLDRAVKAIREGKTPNLDQPLDVGSEVNLHVPTLIPEDYLPDVHERLILYKRIASCTTEEDLIRLREEMVDRFGNLPEGTQFLFRTAEVKLQATALGIKRVDLHTQGGRIEFQKDAKVDPFKLVKLVQQRSNEFSMSGAEKLLIKFPLADGTKRYEWIKDFFTKIA